MLDFEIFFTIFFFLHFLHALDPQKQSGKKKISLASPILDFENFSAKNYFFTELIGLKS